MSNAVVDNAYYDWLRRKVGAYDADDVNLLFDILYHTDFYWTVANDDNRAADGIVLRSTFMDTEGWNTEPRSGDPCSVLEMLIALASRIDNDIMWDGEKDRTADLFWEMVDNLDMDYDDVDDICVKLGIFLDRKYDVNGLGGIFPLRKGAFEDQRNVEIWYQMQSYLMENWEF